MLSAKAPSMIVGIGASAGGIPALEQFFRALPDDSGMAFVIVTHLAPERESQLHRVLATYTALPVRVACDKSELHPDTVHVMPQNAILTMQDGRLHLEQASAPQRERKPVDVFLVSLAADQGGRAAGIILSGGDSDGTLGVKAIREAGGITMAQATDGTDGPANPQMPASAITTGMVDFALAAEDMPARLMALANDRPMSATDSDEFPPDVTPALQDEISALLRNMTGHDFAGYKSRTFLRRVMRRMHVTQSASAASYLAHLRATPAEATELFNDLLINVTNFFRDPEAFAALAATVVAQLFADRGPDKTLRVWIPGCATGEEAYSIAIMLREQMASRSQSPRVQIFATDIDEHALAIARAARYPELLLKGVAPDRLSRFFTREGGSYVLRKEVREMCIFSSHNLTGDPPLSRMDLVSCRNLLIYLGAGLQAKVIPTLHYALRPGGFLFLGSSEGVNGFGDLFAAIDKKHRIFEARVTAGTPRRLPIQIDIPKLRGSDQSAAPQGADAARRKLGQLAELQVIERHAPAHVIATADGEVLHYSPRMTHFLDMPRGAPNSSIFELVRRDLRLDLRNVLRDAQATGRTACQESLLQGERVMLSAEPLEAAKGLFLLVFARPPATSADETNPAAPPAGRALGEREYLELRDRLQSTIEEYENALEELKAANEELLSVNEELQSTNEELEASKEEMQSLNEELSTINGELNASVDDLARANSDLKNLYAASRIATVFLDPDLVIRNFTPAAADLFRIRHSDIGRPLTDLVSVIDQSELVAEIENVLRAGAMVEKRLTATNGTHFLARLVPYRDDGDKIMGVVLAVVDITTLARSEAQQKVLIAELDHRVKNMLAVVVSIVGNSARGQPHSEGFAAILVGRLNAMARAHRLLAKASWQTVSLHDIVALEAACHGDDRIAASGPPLDLPPGVALPLAMILHELATNAVKYGALSTAQGRIALDWGIADGKVTLDWSERGGPAPRPEPASGFGMSLIEGQVKHQLSGDITTRFDPQGLTVTLRFPAPAGQAPAAPPLQ